MKVFLVAGEPSGDRLGAALMDGLAELCDEVSFEGVGGPLMEERGLASLFPMEELSVMGIAEVLPKYPALRRRMIETADAVMTVRPDVLITIDSPDFCLRVAKRVRHRMRIRTVHYVAPSVWAWRPGRAKAMAPHVDQVLALLPFEPPYMEAAGMRCDFVGHPVVSEPSADPRRVRDLRMAAGEGPLVVVLPGSRRSEVSRLMPVFGAALRELGKAHEGLSILLPAVPHLAGMVADLSRDWPETLIVDSSDAGEKRAAFAAADVALAASGTVSLELAKNRTPMVVAYDMSWLSWQIMHRMALIDTVTLVNLIVGQKIVPEFLGPNCQPSKIAAALADTIEAPGAQNDALDRTMAELGEDGPAPGLRAAAAVLDGLAQDKERG
ncbi:lipid-A-disaccharide synthase [Palleronia sp. LCG004]|uniref:lipid-A-disaccharide synthase n=1 Tax=Palleronia sp. LCG004 TaxID=3079304 RepID=UPI002943E6ED|nr:lipid-A-disaccharide synthase [Palleronia sp. LCG004]WOI57021.1 lipid-A-disaccharide synthase [Palleronia sp. LCG004]